MIEPRPYSLISKTIQIDLDNTVCLVVNIESQELEIIHGSNEHQEHTVLLSMHLQKAREMLDFLKFALWKT